MVSVPPQYNGVSLGLKLFTSYRSGEHLCVESLKKKVKKKKHKINRERIIGGSVRVYLIVLCY